MPEEILKVFMTDLATVRIICQKCHGVIEMDVHEVGKKLKGSECPLCRFVFSIDDVNPQELHAFQTLTKLFEHLEKVKDKFKVEFPIKMQK